MARQPSKLSPTIAPMPKPATVPGTLTNATRLLLNNLYRNPENVSYMGGIRQLFTEAVKHDRSITRAQVKHWLLSQQSYALAPPLRYKHEMEHIIVYNRHDLGAADLAEFQPLARFNNGIRYLFVYHNCFSKRISVGLLHSKEGIECAKVFRNMLINEIKFIPRTLVTDRGLEFLNSDFRSVCAEFNIKQFQPRKGKAVHAENAIRYLKNRIYRYMRDTDNKRYVDILPQIVSNYNNSVRLVLGIAPNKVEVYNQFRLFNKLYSKYLSRERVPIPKFNIGDLVRIRVEERTFEKEYFPKYSTERYRVTDIFYGSTPPKYIVQALQDSTFSLRLLERELLPAPDNEVPAGAKTEIGLHRRRQSPRHRVSRANTQLEEPQHEEEEEEEDDEHAGIEAMPRTLRARNRIAPIQRYISETRK